MSASRNNVLSFQYRSTKDVAPASSIAEEEEIQMEPQIRLTERELGARLASERAAGFLAAEEALLRNYEETTAQSDQRMIQRLADFEKVQKAYFCRVESEVVQLALAISAKILHREAQVDPMLLAAIVHLALGQLKEGSFATVRVRPEHARRWRDYIDGLAMKLEVKIVEDAELERGDSVLETELGTVNFGLDAQLKEVERGFFDVLAQKPQA